MKFKKGSFAKSTAASPELNELMLRYAQAGNLSGVSSCLLKNADINYKNGAILLIAIYLRQYKLLKLVLAARPTIGLKSAIDLAQKDNNDRMLVMLNEYVAKHNLNNA